MRIRVSVSISCIVLAVYVSTEGAAPASSDTIEGRSHNTLRNAVWTEPDPPTSRHSDVACTGGATSVSSHRVLQEALNPLVIVDAAIHYKCRLMARKALDEFARGPIRNKHQLLPYYEQKLKETFDPVNCFLDNQSDLLLYVGALRYARSNRDWPLVRTIRSRMPDSVAKTLVNRERHIEMETGYEEAYVGSVLHSNMMVKVFTMFPSATHSFTNPPRTFCVDWEEQLYYSNQLHLVNVATGRRVRSLRNLVDASVLWSTSGRYLAVQWRTFQCKRECYAGGSHLATDTGLTERYVNLPSERDQMSIVDTQHPDKVMYVDDYLPDIACQSEWMSYIIKRWENDNRVRMSASWLERDGRPVDRSFHITLLPGGKIEMTFLPQDR